MAAIDLDGHLAETHLEPDLLVEIAGDHEAHDFPFARRQGIEARLELCGERVVLASSAVAFNSSTVLRRALPARGAAWSRIQLRRIS
jgi:hypothetical protein